MAVTLKKPILVVGIGLSALLWMGESLHTHFAAMGQWSLIAAIGLGSGFWWWQKQGVSSPKPQPLPPLQRETVNQAIAKAQTLLNLLATEAPQSHISQFQATLDKLPTLFAKSSLNGAVIGEKRVGKSTLIPLLDQISLAQSITWNDTTALSTETENSALETALDADLVIFIITGDLTDSQWQIIRQLKQNYQRVLLLLNKQDQSPPEDRTLILGQVRERVAETIPVEDVMSVATAPKAVKVLRYQADTTVEEILEPQKADLGTLGERLSTLLIHEKESLIWGSIWRRATQLQQQIKAQLNESRRNQAIPIIEGYQWLAAATALANPVVSLDLLVTAAINAQMVMDLSGIYRVPFSLSQAKTVSGEMGKLMVKLGLVELSTQAIGGLLKSNAITYVAGGVAQGISAAYLTRIAGLSLVAYLQEQEIDQKSPKKVNVDLLGAKIKQVFEQNQRTAFLKGFVQHAMVKVGMKNEDLKMQNFS